MYDFMGHRPGHHPLFNLAQTLVLAQDFAEQLFLGVLVAEPHLIIPTFPGAEELAYRLLEPLQMRRLVNLHHKGGRLHIVATHEGLTRWETTQDAFFLSMRAKVRLARQQVDLIAPLFLRRRKRKGPRKTGLGQKLNAISPEELAKMMREGRG